MFNNYVWENYLNSGGNDIVEMFSKNLTEEYTPKFADSIYKLHKFYCPSKGITAHTHEQLSDLCKEFDSLEDGEYTIKSALDFFGIQLTRRTTEKFLLPIFLAFSYTI